MGSTTAGLGAAFLAGFATLVLALGDAGRALEARAGTAAGYYVPAYYPAPYGGWVDDWSDSYGKARALVDSMTLAEKTNITAGSGIYMGAWQEKKLSSSVCNLLTWRDRVSRLFNQAYSRSSHTSQRYSRCVGNTGSALRVGFPQLCFDDSADGVRDTDNVTAFPDGITVGATFDKSLMYQRGLAIGQEARGKGVNVWLGPVVGPMGRKPKGGRNWEGFGADPVLQAVGARETIAGVQAQGVIATIKHLIGNEQEMYREYNPLQYAYSANIDDRTLHELYLWPFAEGVRAGVGAAMGAYNAVNGSACTQNPYLINGLFKDELGFQGFIMSDWLAQMSGVAAALNGSVPMDRLNDMATRVAAAWYQMGQDRDYPPPNFDTNTADRVGLLYPGAVPDSPSGVVNEFVQVQADHDVIARQIAQEAVTMLKNNESLLPLSAALSLKVFGTDAQTNPAGPNACTDRSCNVGTLGQGWGSGTVNYMYLDDPITNIKSRAAEVTYYNSDTYPLLDSASAGEVAVVFISSDSGENSYTVDGNNGDRNADQLSAWYGGDTLVQEVAAKYDNVVVVAHTVGPLVIDSWIDLPSVKSVLIAHLPGQEAGQSLTNVLFGDASPCGHLPYSITRAQADMPASVTDLINFEIPLTQAQDTYTEGLYIDYRWLNKAGTKPRYAFGHGLSYTNFSFTNASITKVTQLSTLPPARPPKTGILNYTQAIPDASEAVAPTGFSTIWRYLYSWLSLADANAAVAASVKTYDYPPGYSDQQKSSGPRAGGAQGGNPALWDVAYNISVVVANTGSEYSGKASAQLYLQFPEGTSYETPIIQLRDFEKTETLAPGESTEVQLALTRKDVSVWDVGMQDWVVPSVDGRYSVWVGAASDDLGVVCYADTLDCQEGVQGPI